MNQKSFGFGQVLGFGWHVMKDNLWFFVGLGIVLFLIPLPGQLLGHLIQHHPEIVPYHLGFLLFPVTLIIQIILGIGLIKITLSFCDGRKPKLGTLFNAWDCFWKYLGAGLLYGLITVGPGVVCILIVTWLLGASSFPFLHVIALIVSSILIVILLIKFSLCYYFVVDRGLGPVSALRASSRATEGAKGRLFVFGILCGLINILGLLCLVIGVFATFPTVIVASALVYRLLSAQTPELAEFGIVSPDVQPEPVPVGPEIPRATGRKNSRIFLLICLIVFAVVIVAGIAYRLSPKAAMGVIPNKRVELTGIVYGDDISSAVVNGRIVHEEDTINGVRIVEIYRDRVEFERGGQTWSQEVPSHPSDLGDSSTCVTLLELGSHKCPPCRMMTPILAELSREYEGSLNVKSIDVWEDREAAKKYHVRKIPVQIFYDSEGKELFRHIGYISKEDIIAKWSQLGFNLTKTR